MSVPFTAIGPVVSSGGGGDPEEIAAAVWAYATRELTGAVELDSSARVKLAAEQPDCSVLRTGVEYQHTQNSAGDDTVNVTIEEA